jgi:hypothetical protein
MSAVSSVERVFEYENKKKVFSAIQAAPSNGSSFSYEKITRKNDFCGQLLISSSPSPLMHELCS